MSNRNGLIKNDLVNSHHGKSRHTFEMSLYSLYCVVLVHPLTRIFPVDIAENNFIDNENNLGISYEKLTFGHIKELICNKKKQYFPGNIYPHELNLWSVEGLSEGNVMWKALQEKLTSGTEINIKQDFNGNELGATTNVQKVFRSGPSGNNVHIIVEPSPSPATTGLSSISKKRKGEFGEFEFSNRKSVNPIIRNFWLDLCKAQIILKLPDYVDKNIYSSEPYSRYMRVVGNDIVLNEHIMLDSNNKLIRDNGEIVSENITMNFLERNNDGTEKLRPLVKFLRFNSLPKGIVYGISTQEILIKTSYLQMIEVIENDRGADKEKVGCMIIGSPGIGKTHFSLYLAFYITRRHSPADFIYQQLSEGKSHTIHVSQENANVIEYPLGLGGEFPENSFYIADSVIPSLCTTKFTFLVTTPKNDRWHEFDKQRGTQKYYAPIWTDEEIWDVWEWDKRDYKNIISKTRVEELITRWGCVPRRIFNEYNKEPKIGDIVSKCNAFRYLTNEGGDLNDKYSGKAIHIYPSSDFKDKKYVIASAEISRALYDHYAKNSKNIIVDVVRNFAKTAGGPLAGKLFEMMAHDILRKGGKFKVRRLTKDSHEDPDERFPVEELSLKELMHKQFRKIDEISSECYNIPDSPNFKSIDSIAPDCDGTHYLYQMTIADKHSIKVKGLSELESKINDYQPIKLYFVVPNINNLFDDFCEQKYVTTTDTEYVGWDYTTSWIKQNLTQYVLKIDLSDF